MFISITPSLYIYLLPLNKKDSVIFFLYYTTQEPGCHKNVNLANHSIAIHTDLLKIVRVHRRMDNCLGLMVNCFLARGGWLPEQLKMNGGWGVNINITSGLFVSRDAVSDQKNK